MRHPEHCPRRRTQPQLLSIDQQLVGDVAVRDHYALRRGRRARCVLQQGQVVRGGIEPEGIARGRRYRIGALPGEVGPGWCAATQDSAHCAQTARPLVLAVAEHEPAATISGNSAESLKVAAGGEGIGRRHRHGNHAGQQAAQQSRHKIQGGWVTKQGAVAGQQRRFLTQVAGYAGRI